MRISIRLVPLFFLLAAPSCGMMETGEESLQHFLPRLKPLEPLAALRSFEVAEGFYLELVAAEPQVADPIAMAFDENGRIYVAEMHGYPDDGPPGGGPAGRVRLLEDRDGDGQFEKSTIFADGVHWPSGIACWKGGVFVAAAPDIFYMKDTDGDGVADLRRVILTGFGVGESYATINNLKWSLDHLIYGASSYNGGEVRPAGEPDSEAISVRGRDFHFDPVSGRFEAIEGTAGEFGNCFDDWGNRFVANAYTPIIHAVVPARYVERSPHLAVSQLANTNVFQSDRRLFPISEPEPWRVVRQKYWSRWVDSTHEMRAGRFPPHELAPQVYITAAAGLEIYRGSVYPESFQANAFSAEPAGNLVIRMVLDTAGASFIARRANTKKEFIASRDNWFRPVNFVNGPDGCLYVLDMYREVIEDPSAIPEDILEHIDLYAGQDRGRIYRIVPDGFRRPAPPQLGAASTEQLVSALEHPEGWWRETAHRLLFERQDRTAVAALKKLVETSHLGKARLHALWSLKGLDALDEQTVLEALNDAHPGVRHNVVRLAETYLEWSPAVRDKVLTLTRHDNPRVRFQTALTLSLVKQSGAIRALAQITRRDPADQWIRTAVLTGVATRSAMLFNVLARDKVFLRHPAAPSFLKELATLVGARNRPDEILSVLKVNHNPLLVEQSEIRLGTLSGVADGLVRSGGSLQNLLRQSGASQPSLKGMLNQFFEEAQRIARERHGEAGERLEAIRLLGHAPYATTMRGLRELLTPEESSQIQLAVVRALSEQPGAEVGQLLVERWRSLSPRVRSEVAEALFSRADRLPALLDAVEGKLVPITHLDSLRRQTLLQHPDPAIRQRAEKLLSDQQVESRKLVLERYRTALKLQTDPDRGAKVFEAKCATCHRVSGQGRGYDVGPDLDGVQSRSSEELLVNILDPNAQVQSNYTNYRLDTIEGRILTGIIARETPITVTLQRAEGVEDVVLRSSINELTSMGLSLMPEGLEKDIGLQEMADLISFLRSTRKASPGEK